MYYCNTEDTAPLSKLQQEMFEKYPGWFLDSQISQFSFFPEELHTELCEKLVPTYWRWYPSQAASTSKSD